MNELPPKPQGARERRVERELAAARERIETLLASNAEYRAINDELQSANEALLASREELQAINLELQTINGDLADRLAELARAHAEAAGLLASTSVATLLLDVGCHVRRFTQHFAALFAVTDADIGRNIASLGARLPYPELEQDVRGVLHTLAPVRRTIPLADGRNCIVRVSPHDDAEGYLSGTVLTFIDDD